MRTFCAVLGLALVVLVVCEAPKAAEDDTTIMITGEELTLRDQMPERVSGIFVRDGIVLDFETAITDETISLVLRSGNAEVLLDFHMDLTDGSRIATYLSNGMMIEVDAAFVDSLQAGDMSKTGGIVMHGNKATLDELESRPEYRLLAYLSPTLGQQGITGNVYPATFSLHLLGMRVASDLGIVVDDPVGVPKLKHCGRNTAMRKFAGMQELQNNTIFQSEYDYTDLGADETCRGSDSSCDDCDYKCSYDGWGNQIWCGYYNRHDEERDPDYCAMPECNNGGGSSGSSCCSCTSDLSSDPCENNCRGMCGKSCKCWPWVCGDCAYHWGCDVHDQACGACSRSWGLNIPQCAICATPLAVVVAKFGC